MSAEPQDVKPGYITASERAVRRWAGDAESVISENMQHAAVREELVKAIVSEVVNGELREHEHEFWRICSICGYDDGKASDE